LGSSSIVELSQAQLSKTEADIAHTSAKYEYEIQRAILNFQIGVTQQAITGHCGEAGRQCKRRI